MFEHEAVLALISILPKFLEIRHIKIHQNKVKGKENLTLHEQLNSIANELADTYTTSPKQRNNFIYTSRHTLQWLLYLQ